MKYHRRLLLTFRSLVLLAKIETEYFRLKQKLINNGNSTKVASSSRLLLCGVVDG